MVNVKVKVRVSQLVLGPDANHETKYKNGQEFICSEGEAKRLGTSVVILERIQEAQEPIKK